MTGLATPAPDFESIVAALGKLSPFEQRWLEHNSKQLQAAFDEQWLIAQSRDLDLSPFEPDIAAQALRKVIKRQARPATTIGRNPRTGNRLPVTADRFSFRRPCCSKFLGTYPFCNPAC